jgi:hypothetical protein
MFGLGKLRCNFLVIPVLWRFLQDLMLGQTQDCRSTSATREIIKMAMLWVPSKAPKASKLWTVVFSPRRKIWITDINAGGFIRAGRLVLVSDVLEGANHRQLEAF